MELQGKVKGPAKWKVPMFVPDVRTKSIIVAAFHTPANPTLETLMATLPRSADVTIVCPDTIPKPKGNIKFHMIKGAASMRLTSGLCFFVQAVSLVQAIDEGSLGVQCMRHA
jgi:hypothetical protein